MKSMKRFLNPVFCVMCVAVIVGTASVPALAQGQKRVGKEPLVEKRAPGSVYVESQGDRAFSKCFEECLRRNQMQAVGIEVIKANCRRSCEFREAVSWLEARDPKKRIAGVEKLRALRDSKAVPYLAAALKREFAARTGLAAWIIPTLGELGDPKAVPILIESLNLLDESWLFREKAAAALGKIGDPSAIPALIRASERGDTRNAAIIALAGFRDRHVIPALLSALQPEEEKETREAALRGLRALGGEAVPALIEAFTAYSPEHPDSLRRRWLCHLLGESGDAQALSVLRKSLKDPDPAVRACAASFVKD